MKKNPAALAGLTALLALAGCARDPHPRDELQGVVELHQRVLGFEVPGRLATLNVMRGQTVKAGEVLATLDDALEKPQRDARVAELAAAQAQLELVTAGARSEDIRAAEAQLRAAQAIEATASESVRRARELHKAGANTPQQLDEAEGNYSRAKAEREAAEQRLAALRAGSRRQDVRAAQARLDSAKAALALVEARMQKYALRAPIDGVVLETNAEVGEVLGAGGAVATLGEVQRPYVDLFVPEADVGELRVGQKLSVRTDADPARTFEGAVEDVGRRTEFTPRFLYSPKERPNLVVRVRVALRDPEQRLRAGVPAFARVAGAP